MGFSDVEKHHMARLIRHDTDIMIENELPEDYFEFLQGQNLINAISDKVNFNDFNFLIRMRIYFISYNYVQAIIPKGKYRKTKAENIQVKFYVDNEFNLLDRIMEIEDILTPPFRIQIDCGILLQRGFEKG